MAKNLFKNDDDLQIKPKGLEKVRQQIKKSNEPKIHIQTYLPESKYVEFNGILNKKRLKIGPFIQSLILDYVSKNKSRN